MIFRGITAYRAAYVLVAFLVLGAIGLTAFEAVVAPRPVTAALGVIDLGALAWFLTVRRY